MSTAPLVSFVVPCYNYARFLPDCLDSIFAQARDCDFEVLAIDDASTDDTLAVLARYADPRLKVLRNEKNLGHVKTISRGLREARGALVARIDPDDRYRPNFLSDALPVFERYPEVALVYGDAALIDAQGNITAPATDTAHKGRNFKGNEFVALMKKNFVCAPTVIARREAWLEPLPVPDKLAFNDWYFSLMIARKHEFYYLNKVLADYRVHHANHHSAIAVNKSEEPSIFFLLDRIFRETEADAGLEREKRFARRAIYAAQYLDMATKYFGLGMMADARRCYLATLRYAPLQLTSGTILRRTIATALNPSLYRGVKSLFKRAVA